MPPLTQRKGMSASRLQPGSGPERLTGPSRSIMENLCPRAHAPFQHLVEGDQERRHLEEHHVTALAGQRAPGARTFHTPRDVVIVVGIDIVGCWPKGVC